MGDTANHQNLVPEFDPVAIKLRPDIKDDGIACCEAMGRCGCHYRYFLSGDGLNGCVVVVWGEVVKGSFRGEVIPRVATALRLPTGGEDALKAVTPRRAPVGVNLADHRWTL
jgi:hypothetical protein